MNAQQEKRIVSDFIRLHRGETLDAIKAMNQMAELWGVKIDWHVFAAELASMQVAGKATIVERNGMTKYFID
jgi:hypothetical protein